MEILTCWLTGIVQARKIYLRFCKFLLMLCLIIGSQTLFMQHPLKLVRISDLRHYNFRVPKPLYRHGIKLLSNQWSYFSSFISPEANNIIRSGKGVSSKPYLDKDLYTRHMENHSHALHTIPKAFFKFIDVVVDCVSNWTINVKN